MARNQNRHYNLDRLCKAYNDERNHRPRLRFQSNDLEKGREAGAAWVANHATPLLLRMISTVAGKRISTIGFLYQIFIQRLAKAGKPFLSFKEIFDGHLNDGQSYTHDFLEGFVTGASEVWKEVKSKAEGEKAPAAVPIDNNSVANAFAQQAAWKGWHRSHYGLPWTIVVEAATEIEVIEKMLVLHNGDKMALPAGIHPDDVLKEGGQK